MSQISKCPKVTVVLTYWEASGDVSELRYKSLLCFSSKRSYCMRIYPCLSKNVIVTPSQMYVASWCRDRIWSLGGVRYGAPNSIKKINGEMEMECSDNFYLRCLPLSSKDSRLKMSQSKEAESSKYFHFQIVLSTVQKSHFVKSNSLDYLPPFHSILLPPPGPSTHPSLGSPGTRGSKSPLLKNSPLQSSRSGARHHIPPQRFSAALPNIWELPKYLSL